MDHLQPHYISVCPLSQHHLVSVFRNRLAPALWRARALPQSLCRAERRCFGSRFFDYFGALPSSQRLTHDRSKKYRTLVVGSVLSRRRCCCLPCPHSHHYLRLCAATWLDLRQRDALPQLARQDVSLCADRIAALPLGAPFLFRLERYEAWVSAQASRPAMLRRRRRRHDSNPLGFVIALALENASQRGESAAGPADRSRRSRTGSLQYYH